MSAHTRISSKGQVVIPSVVRRDMKLPVGAGFEVVRQDDDILLRRDRKKEGTSIEAITKPYRPRKPLTTKEISSVPEDALGEHFLKKYP
jgi:AbrB family looped-hinge helix DNA binding protein